MEQEPGQDPERDGPAGPQPPPDSSHPGDAGSPRPGASGSGSSGADADADAGAGEGDDGESVFGPWEALEGTLGAAREREELLAGFAPGGVWDKHPPGPELAAAVARAAGPDWRCSVAAGEELIGLLRAMASLQSWAGAGLLGVIRALIRDDDLEYLGRSAARGPARCVGRLPGPRDRPGAGGLRAVGGQDDPGGVGAGRPPARGGAAAAGRDAGRAAGPAGHRGVRGAVGRGLRPGRRSCCCRS